MGHRLTSKVAMVMGAGSSEAGWSNGKAAAALYSREGAVVYAVDINLNAAQATRDLILKEGGTCVALQADVTSSADLKKAVEQITQDHAGLICCTTMLASQKWAMSSRPRRRAGGVSWTPI